MILLFDGSELLKVDLVLLIVLLLEFSLEIMWVAIDGRGGVGRGLLVILVRLAALVPKLMAVLLLVVLKTGFRVVGCLVYFCAKKKEIIFVQNKNKNKPPHNILTFDVLNRLSLRTSP